MSVMDALQRLERMGYEFTLAGDGLTYRLANHAEADAQAARELLQVVKAERATAVAFLRQRLQTISMTTTPQVGAIYTWPDGAYQLISLHEQPGGWYAEFEQVDGARRLVVNIRPYCDPAPMPAQALAAQWLEAFERWEADDVVANDAAHVQRLADLAAVGGLPFYEDGQEDAGVLAWYDMAEKYREKGVMASDR